VIVTGKDDMNTDTEKKDDVAQTSEESAQPVSVAVDPDDEKRGGVKEMAQNPEAIAAEKEKPQEKPPAKPSFFVKKNSRHVITMDVLTSKEDGRIVSVSKAGLGIDFKKDFSFLVHTVLTFDFSFPNYEDMSTYRQRSSVYRREAQQVIVDKVQLRNYLLVWHLKDWNMVDDEGKKITLTFESTGALSDESLAVIYGLWSTLMDVVMTVYEKDMLLT